VNQQREADVLRSVLDLLAAKRIFALRMNVAALRLDTRFLKFGVPGQADVLAFPRAGEVWWIEVKSSTGIQTALQRSFQAQVEAVGHRYLLVRNPDELLQELEVSR